MTDVQSNIVVNIDTTAAVAELKNLQRQMSAFHTQMGRAGAASAASASNLQRNLVNSINAGGQFSAQFKTVATTTETFTRALEANKMSMGQYFRYAGASTKSFGRLFRTEFDTINRVAQERVKTLQTQYVKLGRDANGAMKAIAIRPTTLNMQDLGTKTQIAAQRQALLNQLLKQGSTSMLNFGKNTQWAGRQLMVGFTVPLMYLGTAAAKTFMDIEKEVVRFKRVYGDFNTTTDETNKMAKSLQNLASEFTKYGVAVKDTMSLAADAAAMGKQGADLTAQVTEANRLAVLGMVDQQQALQTTMSLTNAFGVASQDLAKNTDFLNAVENQTVLSIQDLTVAIPKAGPVVKQLGGNVKDLAFFMTAMKEGGINASEGANALKSGLASMINPSSKAANMLSALGVNLKGIVEANKGDLKGTVIGFAQALDKLDPLNRARAIEQLFGKFQFARISTLFQNVIKQGTQAQTTLQLAKSTSEELAIISERELKQTSDSPMYKFQKSVEDLKKSLAPVGKVFLETVTPVVNFFKDLLDRFNGLDEGTKSIVTKIVAVVAGIGPVVLMTFGLLANGVANIIKGFSAMKSLFNKTGSASKILGEQTTYLTTAELEAAAAAASLDQAHQKLTQRFSGEAGALKNLISLYQAAIVEQSKFGMAGVVPGIRAGGKTPKTFATGGIVRGPGSGTSDSIPAMLSNGESVIPADKTARYQPLISSMISGTLPGFAEGVTNLGMPRSLNSIQRERAAAEEVFSYFQNSSFRNRPAENYGHQIAKTSGHSFPIFGIGGLYAKPDGSKVFVKPVLDELGGMAEIRATRIAREAHGLEAPEQRMVVMKDPTDITGHRRFLALESKFNPVFANPTGAFTKDQYFKQLLASLLRGDKDLSNSNLFGNVVADVGPAGVFKKASGVRAYADVMPSLEEQATVNLLGVKGGAKRAFAEATVGLVKNMTAQEYQASMLREIETVLPKLKATVASFGLEGKEKAVYDDMIRRLEGGKAVDWTKFHAMHSAVQVKTPKQSVATVQRGMNPASPIAIPGTTTLGGHIPVKAKGATGKPLASVFDVDGTLFDTEPFTRSGRLAQGLEPLPGTQWISQSAQRARPIPEGLAAIRLAERQGHEIIVSTARPSSFDAETRSMLARAGIFPSKIFYSDSLGKAPKGPKIPAHVMKEKVLSHLQKDYEVKNFWDDLAENRGAAKSLGIKAFNPISLWKRTPFRFADGGIVRGPGSGTSDSIIARISNGEAIVPAASVAKNPDLVSALVSGNIPGFVNGTEFAHVGGFERIGAADLLSRSGVGIESGATPRVSRILTNIAAEFGNAIKINVYGKLGILTGRTSSGQSINNLLGKRGVSQGDFFADWDKQGIQRWKKSLRYAGLKLSDVEQDLTKLDLGMREYILALDKNTSITDKEVKDAYSYSKQKLDAESRLIKSFDALSTTAGEARVNLSRQSVQNRAGIPIIPGGGGSRGAIQIGPDQVRLGGERFQFYGRSGFQFVQNAGAAFLGGVRHALKMNSPSVILTQAGEQAGQSIVSGVEDKVDDAKAAGQQIAAAQISGGKEAYKLSQGQQRLELKQYDRIPEVKDRLRNEAIRAASIGGGDRRYAVRMARQQVITDEQVLAIIKAEDAERIAQSKAASAQRLAQGKVTRLEEEAIAKAAAAEQEAIAKATAAERIAIEKAAAEAKTAADAKYERSIRKRLSNKFSGGSGVGNIGSKVGSFAMAGSMAAMMGSMAGGTIGEISNSLMMPLMGLSMALPMLTNPLGAAAAAVGLLAFGVWKMKNAIDNAKDSGIKLADSLKMTSDKLEKLSIDTGTVSATAIRIKRQENLLSGSSINVATKKYGESFLGRDSGKQILSDINAQVSAGYGNQQIGQNIANSLATAISEGVITSGQAESIALALGKKLKNYAIPSSIIGNLSKLIGPNGEDLVKEPLTVALKIQEQSTQQQKGAFDRALGLQQTENRLSSWGDIALGIGAVITGAVGAFAGFSASITGVGAVFGATSLALAASGVANIYNGWNGITVVTAQNNKLIAGGIELGIQQISQNQQLKDSINRQYDIQVKDAKTQKEIHDLEIQRGIALDAINSKQGKTLDNLQSQYARLKQIGKEGLVADVMKTQIEQKYKDSPLKDLALGALTSSKSIRDITIRTRIQYALASGVLNPLSAVSLTDIIANSDNKKDISQAINFIINKRGIDQLDYVSQLLDNISTSSAAKGSMLSMLGTDSENYAANVAALQKISDLQLQFGITFDLQGETGKQTIAQVRKAIAALVKVKSDQPISIKVVKELINKNPEIWQEFFTAFPEYLSGKKKVTRNLLLNVSALGLSGIKDQAIALLNALVAAGKIDPTKMRPDQMDRARQNIINNLVESYASAGNDLGLPDPKVPGPAKTTGTSAADAAKNKMLALLEKEIRILQRKSDALKKVNDELKRQQDFEMKQAELSKSQIQAKISGDYVGASIIGQQKRFDAMDFKRESDQIALDNRISALEAIVTQIGNKDKIDAVQQALVKKITGLSVDKNGKVLKKANGGHIAGPGSGTSDSIPAYLSNGEYVVKADSVKKYGKGFFDSVNAQKFANGGMPNIASLGWNFAKDSVWKGIKTAGSWIGDQLFGQSSVDMKDINYKGKKISGKNTPIQTAEILSGGSLGKIGKSIEYLLNKKELKLLDRYVNYAPSVAKTQKALRATGEYPKGSQLPLLEQAILKNRVKTNRNLFRTTNWSGYDNVKPGDVITENGFISTSSWDLGAKLFGKNYADSLAGKNAGKAQRLLKIRLPEGSPALDISKQYQRAGIDHPFGEIGVMESEMLLPPKSRFKVIKVNRDGSLNLEYLLDNTKKFANGGLIRGPGNGTSDSILGYAGGGAIRVSNGEYIMKAQAVANNGTAALDALNNGTASIRSNDNSSAVVYNNSSPTITFTGVNDPQKAAEIAFKMVKDDQKRLAGKNGGSVMVRAGA